MYGQINVSYDQLKSVLKEQLINVVPSALFESTINNIIASVSIVEFEQGQYLADLFDEPLTNPSKKE